MRLFHILIDTQNKKKTELENVINIYKQLYAFLEQDADISILEAGKMKLIKVMMRLE